MMIFNTNHQIINKMTNSSIFVISEIDSLIIDFLDYLLDYKQLIMVNKYYHKLINNNPIYRDLRTFSKKKKDMYLHEKYFREASDALRYYCLACKYNYPYVAKYILNKYSIDVHFHNDYPFRLSCIGGNLKLVEWHYSLIENKKNLYISEWGFSWACEHGRLEIAQYLYSLNEINIRIHNDYAFRYSCKNRHSNIIKWLCTICDDYKFKYIFPIPEIDSMIINYLDYFSDFKQLALVNKYYHKHIENNSIYQDLQNFSLERKHMFLDIPLKKKSEEIFCLACKYDYPQVAEYIYHKYSIDIHVENDYAFRLSCFAKDLYTAKWLYSLMENKSNLRYDNDIAFQRSCENGNRKLIKWLCTLCDDYRYKVNYEAVIRKN